MFASIKSTVSNIFSKVRTPNKKSPRKLTLLEAVTQKNKEAVKKLIEQGANIRTTNGKGKTILEVAQEICGDNSDIVTLLKKTVKEYDKNLLKAVKNQNIEEATKWLLRGANPNVKDENGNTPLYLAVDSNNIELVKLLVKVTNCLDWEYHGKTVLEMVKEKRINKIVDYLQKMHSSTDLKIIKEKKTTELVEYLKQQINSNIDSEITALSGNSGLWLSTEDKAKIIDEKLKQKTELNNNLEKDISKLVKDEDEIVKVLKQQLELNDQLKTSIQEKNIENIKQLIASGANVNFTKHNPPNPYYNGSALLLALSGTDNKKTIEIAEILLKNDVIISETSPDLLHSAVFHNKNEMVSFLLQEVKFNVNHKKIKSGQTALHLIAALQTDNKLECAQILIKNNANVNEQDAVYRTPLHEAICSYSENHNNIPLIELLVQSGADIDSIKDKEGFTPLDIAKNKNLAEIVQILELEKKNRKQKSTNNNSNTAATISSIATLPASGIDSTEPLAPAMQSGTTTNKNATLELNNESELLPPTNASTYINKNEASANSIQNKNELISPLHDEKKSTKAKGGDGNTTATSSIATSHASGIDSTETLVPAMEPSTLTNGNISLESDKEKSFNSDDSSGNTVISTATAASGLIDLMKPSTKKNINENEASANSIQNQNELISPLHNEEKSTKAKGGDGNTTAASSVPSPTPPATGKVPLVNTTPKNLERKINKLSTTDSKNLPLQNNKKIYLGLSLLAASVIASSITVSAINPKNFMSTTLRIIVPVIVTALSVLIILLTPTHKNVQDHTQEPNSSPQSEFYDSNVCLNSQIEQKV